MTIEEIKSCTKSFLTANDIAPVVGCDPQCIRIASRENPLQLGFPVTVTGKRTKIPRIPFLRFIGEDIP